MEKSISLNDVPGASVKAGSAGDILRLVFRAVLLGAPFLMFLIWFQGRFARFSPSIYGVKRQRLEQRAPQIETLVLGSSQTHQGVLPRLLGPAAFNLAIVNQSLYYDDALICKYVSSLPSLKTVVISIADLSLEYELDQCSEFWRAYYYNYFFNLPHRDWHKRFSSRNYSAWFLCSERIRAQVVLGACRNAAVDYDLWGGWTWGFGTNAPPPDFQPIKRDAQYLSAKARETLADRMTFCSPANVPANTARLEEVVRQLRQRGTAVVFVSLPVTSYFRQGLNPASCEKTQTTVTQLCRSYGAASLDYAQDPRFTDEDFQDGNHLNYFGAQKFTRILGQDLDYLRGGTSAAVLHSEGDR